MLLLTHMHLIISCSEHFNEATIEIVIENFKRVWFGDGVGLLTIVTIVTFFVIDMTL